MPWRRKLTTKEYGFIADKRKNVSYLCSLASSYASHVLSRLLRARFVCHHSGIFAILHIVPYHWTEQCSVEQLSVKRITMAIAHSNEK